MAGNINFGQTELDLSMIDQAVIKDIQTKTTTPVTPIEVPLIAPAESPVAPVVQEKQELNEKEKKDITELIDDFIIPETSESLEKEETTEQTAPSVFSATAEYLKEQGVVPSLKDASKITTAEDLAKAIQDEIESSKYSGLSPTQKAYMEAIESGVSHEEISDSIDVITNVNKISDRDIQENQQLRIDLIRADLLAQGWSTDRAEKQIKRLVDLKEDVEEALNSKENIVVKNFELIEKRKEEAIKEEERLVAIEAEMLDKLKSAVYSETHVLGHIKVDGALKDKVYKTMTEEVGKDVGGNPINILQKDRLTDPVDFEKRFYYVYVATNGFRDFGRMQRVAESKAAQKLREAVESSGVIKTGSGAGLFHANASIPDIVRV